MMSRAVFLDRDGVINKAVVRNGLPYPPATLRELEIIEGVQQALLALKSAGFKLIVVTNQPDVARGLTPVGEVKRIHDALLKSLAIDEIRACFHDGKENCSCRKPKPGMLLDASEAHQIDLKTSFMVGDRWRDMDAGEAAGCITVFIDEGYDERRPSCRPRYTCRSLLEASEWILAQGGGHNES